ncbi:hypothetical protein CsatA_030211 [Cannabis sativa]
MNIHLSTIILLADYKGKVLLKGCSSVHNNSSRDVSESELLKFEKPKLKQVKDLSPSSSSKRNILGYISFKQGDHKKNNIPVVQWVMSLPNRSQLDYCTIKDKEANEKSVKSRPGWPLLLIPVPPTTLDSNLTEFDTSNTANELELLSTAKSLDCRIFTYEELKVATCSFSSENLIGEGGCSSVYRGLLQGDKSVAIKVLKPYNEAWTDFSLEVNIVTLLNHKHIAPLIGICLENDLLISVYDYYPKGNLEIYLHGDNSGKSIVSWELRFDMAIAVAEALNYLHNNSPQPIIHRDIKPSNILLTNDLQPKARKLLEKEDYKALVDPKLKENIETAQMKRMALAAKLCVSQSARARPKMSQILELLNGEKDADMFIESSICVSNEGYEDDDDKDYFMDSGSKDPLDFEILDKDSGSISSPSCQDSDTTSLSSAENGQTQRFKFRDFLNKRLE